MQIVRGQKLKLKEITSSLLLTLEIKIGWKQEDDLDITCFGLDASGKLNDDRYFIFFNQLQSPEKAIRYANRKNGFAMFEIDLDRLPKNIKRLTFAAAIDGESSLSNMTDSSLCLSCKGNKLLTFPFHGRDFASEKAIILFDIYFKDEWRISAVGQGFNAGMKALLEHFGGQSLEDESPSLPQKPELKSAPASVQITPVTGKSVNLEKGQKISLEKTAGIKLSKIFMGLGWDVGKNSGLFGIDLDASCGMFNASKKLADTVAFYHLKSKDGSVKHTGDNLTGEGEGDDEQILVDLNRIAETTNALVFTVNRFSFFGKKTLKNVKNAFCRIVNTSNNNEIARYELSVGMDTQAIIMAKVYRDNGEWKIHAIGEPASGNTFEDLVPTIEKFL